MIQFNKPPITVKLTKEELNEFWLYLNESDKNGFTGVNNFVRYGGDREEFMQWHVKELATKTLNKLTKLTHEKANKKTTIKINFCEQKTLSMLFKRVGTTPFFLQMQPRFLVGLVKTNRLFSTSVYA